ncbi:MAG: hypothetical protein LUG16_06030 [Candidatus Gastranaerophilales bacterium]|nr:hypothetical protein [Candidatus Gastranaerophilales bacterium]
MGLNAGYEFLFNKNNPQQTTEFQLNSNSAREEEETKSEFLQNEEENINFLKIDDLVLDDADLEVKSTNSTVNNDEKPTDTEPKKINSEKNIINFYTDTNADSIKLIFNPALHSSNEIYYYNGQMYSISTDTIY